METKNTAAELERRHVNSVEVRLAPQAGEAESSQRTIEGYAALFNVETDLGGLYERIARGAFTESLASGDVRALYNHDNNLVLGRTKSGTLTLVEDEKGLRFSCKLPDTSYARDLSDLLKRGDIDGCSFGFTIEDEDFETREDGSYLRELRKVNLIEVTLGCTFPAYPTTSISLRSLEQWKESREREEFRSRLYIAKLKLQLMAM